MFPALVKHLREFPMVFELYTQIRAQISPPSVLQIQAAQGEKTPQVLQYLQDLTRKLAEKKAVENKVNCILHIEKLF